MRRQTLNLLRCPRCSHGSLVPESEAPTLEFGPIHCNECHARFPVSEGILELGGEPVSPAPLQRGFDARWFARGYERTVRPAVTMALARRRLDRETEFLAHRSLLGSPAGPVLDLGCGTGLVTRRLARDPDFPVVVGLDASRAMLDEGVLQAREAGVTVDFIRGHVPGLPFVDRSLAGVVQVGSLHYFDNLPELLREVYRVLRPGGRFVASTLLPPPEPLRFALQRAGLYCRDEVELREQTTAAGFVGCERLLLAPFIVFKAKRPAGR